MTTSKQNADLTTYEGWKARAIELLQNEPYGRALVDFNSQQYILLIEGEICTVQADQLDLLVASTTFNVHDAASIDATAWVGDAWDGKTPQATQEPLLNPHFIDVQIAQVRETASLRLTLDVTYALNGESLDHMVERLHRMCERAIGEGMLTGDSASEAESYSINVEKTWVGPPR